MFTYMRRALAFNGVFTHSVSARRSYIYYISTDARERTRIITLFAEWIRATYTQTDISIRHTHTHSHANWLVVVQLSAE